MRMASHALAATYLAVLLGLWATSLVESVGAPYVAVSAALAALSLPHNLWSGRKAPAWAWNSAAAACLALFAVDLLAFSGELITSGSRLLALLAALKLFDLRGMRDHSIVFGLTFFQVLASAASTSSPAFFLILSLYIVTSIWAMIIFSVMKDLRESASGPDGPRGLFGAPFFLAVVGLSAACLMVTLAIFFTIPRMGVGLFERKTLSTLKVSGFSERVDLGSIGTVKLDPTVVMRVEVAGGKRPVEALYFRGMTLDSYDGGSWTRRAGRQTVMKREGGHFTFGEPGGRRLLEHTILLEPLDTEVIFAASDSYRVEGRFPALWVDAAGALRLPVPPFSRIEYRAWSELSGVRKEALGPSTEYLDASYLDKSPEAEGLKALVAEAVAGAPGPMEKALAIEQSLRAGYAYTLSPSVGRGSGPLEDFLLHTKEGYCEHFSTAMVMMLRSAGVPARLVTGFMQGEWNELGAYFIVRQQDAHSWVEAYIAGQGWVRFDPTPSAPRPYAPSTAALYLDLARLKWNRYVIQYSLSDQRKLARSFERGASGLLDTLKGKAFMGAATEKRAILGSIAALAAAIAVIYAMSRIRRGRSGGTGASAPRYYLQMLSLAAKKGFRKGPAETPGEFADRVKDPAVDLITQAHSLERYRGLKPGPQEAEKVRKALERLRKGGPGR